MPLTGSFNLGARLVLTGTDDFGIPSHTIGTSNDVTFTDGAGVNQVNQVWADAARSINASTSDDLDLSGVLTNKLGQTVSFVRVKGIYVRFLTSTATFVLNVGGGSNPFINYLTGTTPVVVIRAGGTFCLIGPDATGYAVTAGTGDILRINNPNAAAITYDIIIVGATS